MIAFCDEMRQITPETVMICGKGARVLYFVRSASPVRAERSGQESEEAERKKYLRRRLLILLYRLSKDEAQELIARDLGLLIA